MAVMEKMARPKAPGRVEERKGGAQTDSKVNAIIAWNMDTVQNGAPRQAKVEQAAK